MLFQTFVKESTAENGFSEKTASSEVHEALVNYSWPGNIRELRNLAERLVVLSGGQIKLHDLPNEYKSGHFTPSIPPQSMSSKVESIEMTFKEFKISSERRYLVEVLKKTRGNISQASKLLDIERTYLHKKIQELGIEKREYF